MSLYATATTLDRDMPQITTAIGQSRLELVRDRIGTILRDELTNQATLQASTDPDLSAQLTALNVYAERFYPINDADMPAIDIFFFNADFDNKDLRSSKRGIYQYYIDIFTASDATTSSDADRTSSLRAHRLAMLVHDILENPNYITLGFTPSDGVVQRTLVSSVKRTEESNTRDGRAVMMYRLIYEVVVTENTETISPSALSFVATNVRIEETNLGYEYLYTAP